MAISLGPAGGGDDEMTSTINTTPLVDVMLVLLIIFLVTIPVVTHTVPVNLPKEINQPTETTPKNINISVTKEGDIFWNQEPVKDYAALLEKMKAASVTVPQPEVHIRGDRDARYEFVGKVVVVCQRAGISRIGFITEPPHQEE